MVNISCSNVSKCVNVVFLNSSPVEIPSMTNTIDRYVNICPKYGGLFSSDHGIYKIVCLIHCWKHVQNILSTHEPTDIIV